MQSGIIKHRLFLLGILLTVQFAVVAQQDSTSSQKLKAIATDDSIPAKPLSSIPKDERTPSIVPDKGYFKSILTDTRDIVISPARWNKYQWIAVSGVIVVAGLLYTQDANIQKVVQKNQTPYLNYASKYGLERLGSGIYTIPALAVMYGVGAIVKDDKARYTALKGVEAFAVAFVFDQVLKQITHRHRPYQDDPPNPYLWDGPFNMPSNSSFASGHAANAFAVATVIATSYSKTIWVPILCYTFAGLTAASRVYQNDHWFTDVFVGSAIGFAIGRTIMNNHIKKLKVLPVSPTGTGATLIYQLDRTPRKPPAGNP
jgi:membrane-associated phospholipid phosphatase